MRYLHTMVRVTDLDASLHFYCDLLGLAEQKRVDVEAGRFTLVFLAAPENPDALVELTYNWYPEVYGGGRNFGHLAYEVEDIYETCQRLMDGGVTINHGTAAWPSSAPPTRSRSSSSRREGPARPRSPGPRWRTSASGSARRGHLRRDPRAHPHRAHELRRERIRPGG